jgi:mannose-1-phosphate guanylyltransferase
LASGDGKKNAKIVGDVYIHPSAKVHPTAKVVPFIHLQKLIYIISVVTYYKD